MFCNLCKFKSLATQYLSNCELMHLEKNCKEVQFESGDIIIKQGSFSTNVSYLKKGLVKVHVIGAIKEKIVKIVKAPAYLCLPSVFGDNINHFSTTSIEKSEVCFIDGKTFKEFIHQNSDFAFQIIQDISKEKLLDFKIENQIAQKQIIGRIAVSILFFSKDIYKSNNFVLPISRQDLGDMIGVARESVCRILTDFHNENILKVDGKKITIINEFLLQKIGKKC